MRFFGVIKKVKTMPSQNSDNAAGFNQNINNNLKENQTSPLNNALFSHFKKWWPWILEKDLGN